MNPDIEALVGRAQQSAQKDNKFLQVVGQKIIPMDKSKKTVPREAIRSELEDDEALSGPETKTEGINERIRQTRLNEEEIAKQREEIYQLVMKKRLNEGRAKDLPTTIERANKQEIFAPVVDKNMQVEFNNLIEEVDKLKKENFILRERVQEKESEVNALSNKLEVNEKFWLNKVQSTDKNYTGLSFELQNAMNAVKQAHSSQKAIEEQYNKLKERSELLESTLKDSQERNSEYIQKLDELMRRTGEQAKENEHLSLTRKEMQDELNINSGQLNELRRIVKSYEDNLNKAHGDSLKEQEVYRARLEELNKRVRDYERQNNDLKGQMLKLSEEKSRLLQDKVRWEATFEAKVQENEMEKLRRVDAVEKEWREKVDKLEISFARTVSEKEDKFRQNMDGLEGEFKQVLVDANEKYKKTRLLCENLKAENVRLI